MSIQALRTDASRFDNLPDWPYEPKNVSNLAGYEGLQVAVIDEGKVDAERTFLCLHGQPTWSYLYRKMIPIFLESGARVVAPDLLGFGRSDKPIDDSIYTYNFHRNMLVALIEHLNLKNITLVCQDWGGLLGLPIVPNMSERFERLIVMNTGLPIGITVSDGFNNWKAYNRANPDLPIGQLMKRANPHLTDAEIKAYDAPFPDQSYKAGVRRFPELVMIEPEMEGIEVSKRAREWFQNDWTGETFLAWGKQDIVFLEKNMLEVKNIIRNCPAPLIIEEAGHFVQEWGDQVAIAALKAFGDI